MWEEIISTPSVLWAFAAILGCLFVIITTFIGMMRPSGVWISWHHDPHPECPDCDGEGIIPMDAGESTECPCTMRVFSC